MENLVKIAEDVLTSCLAVKTGEEVLIITDDSRKEIGEAIYEAAGNLGCEKLLMVMKEREVSGQEPPKAIAAAMKAADVVIVPTAQSLTHTNARIEAAKAGTRVATMPGITKEMWAECQVQKKKNSKSYQRTLTYLYLQKLKCPKCNRILGGKATTKKNGKAYFYYYCNDCKIEFKENIINDYFNNFIDELTQYDSVVNQFFLPMIKQKFDEPKEQLEKEIKNQNNKLERIKKAYINGAFDVKEYKEEKHIVEKAIKELQNKLDDTDCAEELRFTPQDILLKRDIDFINKLKLNKEYKEQTKQWKDYTRKEKAELIMKYVDEIELDIIGKEISVKQINFRESICKPYQQLYDDGYIDTTKPAIFGNVVGNIRFSNYLPENEVGQIIMRLKQYYDVSYTEAIYYVKDQVFYFNFNEDNSAIVRVFPLKDYYKIDPENKMETYEFGIIYIKDEDKFQMKEVDNAFNFIPDETNDSVIYTKDTTPISIGVKPVKITEEKA